MTRWDRAPAAPTLRVITQYWRGRVRVCELEKSGHLLDVHISRNEQDSPREWRIEAHSGHADSAKVIAESGVTRADAFSAVAREWAAQAPALGLPAFDWEAVATVLRAVDAID